MTRRLQSREAGFTLLEVMIAIAILALMMTMIWYSFAQVFRTIDVVRADSDLLRQVRQVTSRIPDELSESYLPDNNFSSPSVTVKYEFVGTDNGELDRVRFLAFAHTKFYEDANESDECELEYWTESDRNPKNQGLYKLMRREDTTPDDRPDEGGTTLVIADRVKSFNLQYYDPNRDQWYDEWDTTRADNANRLPYAVRMKVVFVDSDKQDREFVTATTIRLAKPQEPR